MRLFRKTAPRLAVKYQSLLVGMGAARWLERSYQLLATEGFESNPVVYSCVSKLAKAASAVDLELYRKKKNGDLEEIKQHPILDLLNRPNPMHSGRRFLEKLATQYLIGGNAYILGLSGKAMKPPTELWLLPPQAMKVNTRPSSMLPAAYEYKQGNREAIVYPVDQITGLSQICHLKTVNPLNEFYGLPPLAAAAHGVDIFNAGMQWNKSLLQNEGRPSGALQMKADPNGGVGTFTDDQFQRLKEQIDTQYSGSGNAGRPLLLDGGLEWVQMSMSATDMDHRENMLTNARFIAACYGTPPQLVNIPGESTYSNYEQAMLSYYSDTVIPFLCGLLEEINRWLPALFKDDVFLWFDEEQITALEPRRKEKSDRLNASGFMTINEKRDAMGMEPVDGGDVIFIPATDIPLDLAGIVDPKMHPVLASDTPQQAATAEEAGAPGAQATPTKHRQWLESQGYSPEKAERLTKLVYG